MPITIRQIANVVTMIVVFVINTLATMGVFNNLTPDQVANQVQPYFFPAGYAFGIWSIIYTGLIAFTVYQALPSQRDNVTLNRLGYLFVINGVFNIAWVLTWHYEYFTLGLPLMVGLLGSLIAITLQLGIGVKRVNNLDHWLVHVPFSMYLGWVSVATIANFSWVWFRAGWEGAPLTHEAWAVIMMAVAVALTAAVVFVRGNVTFALVVAWAIFAISVRHPDVSIVVTASYAATGLVLVLALVGGLVFRQRAQKQDLLTAAT